MNKITNVRTSVKEDRTLAIISVEGSETPIFLTSKQVASATGLDRNFSILKGSKINVTFYKKGEKMLNDRECTADDKIVKEFDFELADRLNDIASASAFGASMF